MKYLSSTTRYLYRLYIVVVSTSQFYRTSSTSTLNNMTYLYFSCSLGYWLTHLPQFSPVSSISYSLEGLRWNDPFSPFFAPIDFMPSHLPCSIIEIISISSSTNAFGSIPREIMMAVLPLAHLHACRKKPLCAPTLGRTIIDARNSSPFLSFSLQRKNKRFEEAEIFSIESADKERAQSSVILRML